MNVFRDGFIETFIAPIDIADAFLPKVRSLNFHVNRKNKEEEGEFHINIAKIFKPFSQVTEFIQAYDSQSL